MYGMRRLLLLLPCVACAGPQPTPAAPLPNYASRLAAGLERQAELLGRETRAAFPAGGVDAELASSRLATLTADLDRQVLAWRSLEAHALEIDQVLGRTGTVVAKLEGLTLAFRDLHLRLRRIGLGVEAGIGLADQRRVEDAMLGAADPAEAIAVSLPTIRRLLKDLEADGQALEARVDELRVELLARHAAVHAGARAAHEELGAWRAELERRQAAAAAGAAPADPDAARGLAAVEADWTRSLAAMAEIDRQARALDESYREAGRHVHGLGRAAVEWAVALREVGKAMEREREQANLGLIEASVEELGA